MSIKYKIAFWFSLLVTTILGVVSLSVYFFSAKERDDTFKMRLKNRALTTARLYDGIRDADLSVLKRMDTAAGASLNDKSISVIDDQGSYVYMFSSKPADSLFLSKEIIEKTKIENEYYFSFENKKAIALSQLNGNRIFIVALAASDLDEQEYLNQLKKILLISLVLSVFLSFLAGIFFAANIIRPIKKIIGEVKLITYNNLSQRIKINKDGDELTSLAETFNHLLDRLQDAFAIQRRFISNASHELSTPLTSISSQLEVAMQKNRTPEEYRDLLQSVSEDIKDLQQLTLSLLDIAKAGSQGSIDLSEVRIDEVLLKVVSDLQKQHKNYKVQLNFEIFPEDEKLITVFGNENLLYIALKNIIENGCKYADNHQSDVTTLFDNTSIIIKVHNQGDIIAESDIENIFQPFFRAGNIKGKPGFGLGLTLTKRLLSLHKGVILVESGTETGTIFTIQLPNILHHYKDHSVEIQQH